MSTCPDILTASKSLQTLAAAGKRKQKKTDTTTKGTTDNSGRWAIFAVREVHAVQGVDGGCPADSARATRAVWSQLGE